MFASDAVVDKEMVTLTSIEVYYIGETRPIRGVAWVEFPAGV